MGLPKEKKNRLVTVDLVEIETQKHPEEKKK